MISGDIKETNTYIPWQLHDVRDLEDEHHSLHLKYLYDVMAERLKAPETNISHTVMPTYEEHVHFVMRNRIYGYHFVIANSGYEKDLLGCGYVSENNELGIYISPKYRRRSIAREVISMLIEDNPDIKFLANINQNNEASIALFKSLGFRQLSITMIKDATPTVQV